MGLKIFVWQNILNLKVIALVGNKDDLIDSEAVKFDEAKAYARVNWYFILIKGIGSYFSINKCQRRKGN
jgi:hypothetical protein